LESKWNTNGLVQDYPREKQTCLNTQARKAAGNGQRNQSGSVQKPKRVISNSAPGN
jgi:hypothetical protein